MDSNAVISKFKEAHVLYGVFSRVAQRLGVSSTHVREVAVGNRSSARVMKELTAEVKRAERQVTRARDLERVA